MEAGRGDKPVKCPHCPESVDVVWSPAGIALQHRGQACEHFAEWTRVFATLAIEGFSMGRPLFYPC